MDCYQYNWHTCCSMETRRVVTYRMEIKMEIREARRTAITLFAIATIPLFIYMFSLNKNLPKPKYFYKWPLPVFGKSAKPTYKRPKRHDIKKLKIDTFIYLIPALALILTGRTILHVNRHNKSK